MRIKGAVFDFGGVIAKPPEKADVDVLSRLSGLSPDSLSAGFAAHRAGYDGGLFDCAEMYLRMIADNGLPAPSAETLAEMERVDSESWSRPRPETLDWMEELSRSGVKIGILTNMSETFAGEWFAARFPRAIAVADAIVISSREKCVKPQPEIYRIMEKRIGLAPDELCFMDDIPRNVEGAKALGWHGIVYGDFAAARAAFEELQTG